MDQAFKHLTEIMATLRTPEKGCPWDLQQTHESLIPYLLEESHEVIEAIEQNDSEHLKEELGDLLFQVVFHARIAEEAALFNLTDVAHTLGNKLVRRHPHVFSDTTYDDDEAREAAWEQQKQLEHGTTPQTASVLETIPSTLPALMFAQKLQRRAARTGFDWSHARAVIPKIHEEIEEIEDALQQGDQSHIEEEVGDLLFAVVNLARHLKVDAEQALRRGNRKFTRRFQAVETRLRQQDRSPEEATLDEMDALWDIVKAAEKKTA